MGVLRRQHRRGRQVRVGVFKEMRRPRYKMSGFRAGMVVKGSCMASWYQEETLHGFVREGSRLFSSSTGSQTSFLDGVGQIWGLRAGMVTSCTAE